MTDRLLLVGCGKMGGALLAGWLASGVARSVVVVEPDPRLVPDHPAVRAVAGPADLGDDAPPSVIVLAVKPQSMDAVLPAYGRLVGPGTAVLSIAAGRTLGWLAGRLGPGAPIVRAMPNTPAAIGLGISVLVAGPGVTAEQRDRCGRLMSAVGEVAWVEDEALMDPVTALSGGGPAYVFLLIEQLAEAGVRAGLPAALARRLALRTVVGAGALAGAAAEPPEQLRRDVTSPNGTTEAALRVLMAPDGLQPLLDRAIEAASRRSAELAG